MLKLDPHSLYSRADLAEALAPMKLDVDTFIARLKPKKVFRACWLGADLIRAFEAAEPLADREGAAPPAARNRGNRRRGGKKSGPLAPLQALMMETHDGITD